MCLLGRYFFVFSNFSFKKNFVRGVRKTKKTCEQSCAIVACLLTCVCNVHVLSIPFKKENKLPIKLNIAYKIVNLSRI